MEASKQHRRKIRALFSPYTKTDDKGVRWCGHELTTLEILPRRGWPAAPLGWTGSHGCEWAPPVERNSWSPLGSPVACVCLCLSENPSPVSLSTRVQFEPWPLMKTSQSTLQQRHGSRGPEAAHTVLVLHAMLVLILQAEEVPTSERHKQKEQHSWGRCWLRKATCSSHIQKSTPIFHLK